MMEGRVPKNLLVADDSAVVQKSIGIAFAGEGYAITFAENGEEAFLKAKQSKPDLILADTVMPKKNGYELCELVKRDADLRSVPVLLLAGAHEGFDDARSRAVGASGHITKPFESGALIGRVRDAFAGKHEDFTPPPKTEPAPSLNLSQQQVEEIVAKVFEKTIERIAWKVVPDLAEKIIKEELARLTQDKS